MVDQDIDIETYVGNFIFEHLDELVEDDRDDGASAWTDPVDPVFSVEDSGYNAWTEGPSWVQRATGVVDTNKFGNEERETDAYRSDERCSMFFFCEQEDLYIVRRETGS